METSFILINYALTNKFEWSKSEEMKQLQKEIIKIIDTECAFLSEKRVQSSSVVDIYRFALCSCCVLMANSLGNGEIIEVNKILENLC